MVVGVTLPTFNYDEQRHSVEPWKRAQRETLGEFQHDRRNGLEQRTKFAQMGRNNSGSEFSSGESKITAQKRWRPDSWHCEPGTSPIAVEIPMHNFGATLSSRRLCELEDSDIEDELDYSCSSPTQDCQIPLITEAFQFGSYIKAACVTTPKSVSILPAQVLMTGIGMHNFPLNTSATTDKKRDLPQFNNTQSDNSRDQKKSKTHQSNGSIDLGIECLFQNFNVNSTSVVENSVSAFISQVESKLKANSLPLKHCEVGIHLKFALQKNQKKKKFQKQQFVPLGAKVNSPSKINEISHKLKKDFDKITFHPGTPLVSSPPSLEFHIMCDKRIYDFKSVPRIILSHEIFQKIQKHLPYACSEDNFWLRYSIARDVSDSADVLT